MVSSSAEGDNQSLRSRRDKLVLVAANCPQEHVDLLSSNHPNIPVHRLQMEWGTGSHVLSLRQPDLHNRCGRLSHNLVPSL